MSRANTQISAHISQETRMLMEEYVKTFGVKKAFLIESALRHHLLALQELPGDVVVPPRMVVSSRSGEAVLERVANPGPASEDLKALFKVDAKPDAAAFYARFGFEGISVVAGALADRPLPVSMFLPIGTITAAIKG